MSTKLQSDRDQTVPAASTPTALSVSTSTNLEHGSPASLHRKQSYSFGLEYENNLCDLINRHLDLDTNDHLLYVEPDHPDHGSIVPLLCDKFFLTEPVTLAFVGQSSPAKSVTSTSRSLDELLSQGNPVRFTKILFKDSVHYYEDFSELLSRFHTILSNTGKILMIYRSASLNTLPLFETVKERLFVSDPPIDKILLAIKKHGFEVKWKFESLKCLVSTLNWIAMLQEQCPPPIEKLSSRQEIRKGIQELSSGMLRYSGKNIEFVDQLMFMNICFPSAMKLSDNSQRMLWVKTKSKPGPSFGSQTKKDRIVTVKVDQDIEKCLLLIKREQGTERNKINIK